MSSERERWDARHHAPAGDRSGLPDARVLRVLEGLDARGAALDLACGRGRHALELGRRGYRVEAWDFSPVALQQVEARARRAGLVVRTRAVDLVEDGLPADTPGFDLVVLVDFLDRPLYRELHRLLVPGGELVLSTFTVDWAGDRPSPRYRLEAGEAQLGLPGLETVLAAEEGGRALLHARRALKGT